MIIQKQSGLGRGLGALIPPKPVQAPVSERTVEEQRKQSVSADKNSILQIPIEQIEPNPHQPRHYFDHAQLEELISSIKEHGVIQPLVVSPKEDGTYQLIAGERRFRASTLAGFKTVPALLRNATEQEKLELAIIENVQRQDLNAIEEAKAYIRLMNEFNLTQDEVSTKVGKSRPQVANTVRLLQLPEEIQQALVERKISASNARTLLSLPVESERLAMFHSMLQGNFTVRQTEEHVQRVRGTVTADPNVVAAENKLRGLLKARVSIKRNQQGAGEIKIKFHSDEEFEHLVQALSEKEEE